MNTTFRETCINLRRRGYTLPQIVRKTGRSKTSVYFHIRDLPLSAKKKALVLRSYGRRIRTYALARKGLSTREFTSFNAWDIHTVSLVSHLLFDGDIDEKGVSYNNRNVALIRKVEQSTKRIYSFPPRRYTNPLTGVQRISYYNVALSSYLKSKSVRLLKEILFLPKELKIVFLRAFFDDEGCADFRKKSNRRAVRGYQKNTAVLVVVKQLLDEFTIDSSIRFPNEIIISGKSNLIKFRDEINFSAGVRINGRRPNSIWKRSLEKREILRRAIASYKS